MSTTAERMLQRAMPVLTGQTAPCYTFGGVRFRGVTPRAMESNPVGARGLAFGKEHALEITALVSDFTNGLPKPGATIMSAQGSHIVSGVNYPPGSHLVIIQVSQPVL